MADHGVRDRITRSVAAVTGLVIRVPGTDNPGMSWDVLFQDLPRGIRSIEEVPEDYEPKPLCTRAELIAKVTAVAPHVDFSDPTWGRIDGHDHSIELNVGEEDPVVAVMLHVRGGDSVLGLIHELALALDVLPLDCSSGELLDFESDAAKESLRAWREFRDAVVSPRRNG
jgi:hypothetical protein